MTRLSWRWIYYLTSGAGIAAWLSLIAFVPETRWIRSNEELGKQALPPFFEDTLLTPRWHVAAGTNVYGLPPGETRPRIDAAVYGPRTYKNDFGIFVVSSEWKRAAASVWETIKTTFFPNVLWVILVNSILVSAQGAAGQVGSSVLIAAGWKFDMLGFAVVPLVIASPIVWFFGGYVADKISNAHARRNGGRREPEAHLLSLILPLAAGIAGPVLFGYAGQNIKDLPSIVVLISIFLTGFSYLTTNTLFSVYLVESYPSLAG